MIISIINTKGGAGKTTSAMMLAAAWAGRGENVTVYDTDPQGSATEWSVRAADAADPLPFSVLPANQVTLQRLAPSTGHAVIDTPPGNPDLLDAAVRVSDLIVVPTTEDPADMERMWKTVDALQGSIRVVLLCKVDKSTRNYKAAVELLEEDSEVAVFNTHIGDTVRIANLYGSMPRKNLFGYAEVLDEITELMA